MSRSTEHHIGEAQSARHALNFALDRPGDTESPTNIGGHFGIGSGGETAGLVESDCPDHRHSFTSFVPTFGVR